MGISPRDGCRPALMTDLYQLTMTAGYVLNGRTEETTFELFVRDLPTCRSYLVAAGLEQAVAYLTELRFEPEDVDYLRTLPPFRSIPETFFRYLETFRFEGDVWGVREGTPVFANEPILQVRAPLPQAQMVETFLLNTIHFQTLIATKASRVVEAAEGAEVVDFGTRRAHGPEAAVLAARACYIGGCVGTSNVCAGRRFGIPVYGTAAHSWTLAFDSEQEAFERYHAVFPDASILLIDTYDARQGARNAARLGKDLKGVRLDSGDLARLSVEVRRILDEAGLSEARIVASGDLNEYKIRKLVQAGAPIDLFGVGTEMVTSRDEPALGAVYKMVERRRGETTILCAKFSEGKETYPGRKQVWRILDAEGRCLRDEVRLHDEEPPEGGVSLMRRVLRAGEVVERLPSLEEIRTYAGEQRARLPAACRRLDRPERYPVVFSRPLRRRLEELRGKMVRPGNAGGQHGR